MWSYWFAHWRTGKRVDFCVPSSCTWSRKLNAAGEGRLTFQLGDGSGLNYKELTTPWKYLLVVCWNRVPVFAGYMLTRRKNSAKNTLDVGLFGFRVIMGKRSTLGGDGYSREFYHTPIGSDAPGDGYSLSTIAKFQMRLLVEGPTGNFGLPVVLPTYDLSVHDGDQYRDYRDFEGPVLEKVEDDLMNGENGPDIDFALSEVNGYLVVTPRFGTPAQPHLIGPTYDFNLTTPGNGFADFSYYEDGSNMATDVTYMGKGSGLIRPAGDARREWDGPALQRIATDTTLETDEQAASKARADLALFGTPTIQWEVTLFANGTPNAAQLQEWPILRVYSKGDDIVSDGYHHLRVVEVGGNGSAKLSNSIQPMEVV